MNLYNENDPYCIRWLRNLIYDGQIPFGIVDDRSIEDLEPDLSNDLRNFMPSLVLVDGLLHLDMQDGQSLVQSGQVLVHVSLSARQAKALGLLTSGTYGQPSSGSLASVALTSSLANRLKDQLAGLGSILWQLTWKDMTMPSGRRFSLLRASAHPKSDTGLTGWPTATTRGGQAKRAMTEGRHGSNLNDFTMLTGWPIPGARDWKGASMSPELTKKRELQTRGKPLSEVAWTVLTGWPTPTKGNADGSEMAKDASPTGKRQNGSKATVALPAITRLAGWPIARESDGKKNVRTLEGSLSEIKRKGGVQDLAQAAVIAGPARLTASGEIQTGFTAETTSGGQLNPAHSRWLMGFPPEWDACAPTATPSASRKRLHSLKR
jgi:hypothetical protein